MRTRKMRAWESKKKEWHYFELPYSIGQPVPGMSSNLWYEDWCDYIDRKDKNGKEIYEGDICILDILGTAHLGDLRRYAVIIFFKNSAWGFIHTHPNMVSKDDIEWKSFWRSEDKEIWKEQYFEVIGNIHETPELLCQ